MRVEIDWDKCIGAGQCVRWAPEVFDQNDDDGEVVLLDGAPPTERHREVWDAVDACPARAIMVEETGGT